MKLPLRLGLSSQLRRITPLSLLPRGRVQFRVFIRQNCNDTSAENEEDFFRNTTGRWFWNEKEQLRKQFRRFDVASLKEIAASAAGAQRCLSMFKLAEGGPNKDFRLAMDNGSSVIARIPNRNTETVSRTVASEVATMDFASRILGIPVPEVLAWSDNISNPVQSEYILMAEARGKPLWKTWYSMEAEAKDAIVKELVSIEVKLCSISFSRYGNIYFADHQIPGCEEMQIEGSIAPMLKAEAERRYVIGPVSENSFWEGERKHIPNFQGPWSTPQEYIRSICQRELTWLRKFAKPGELLKRALEPALPKDPKFHIGLYQKLLKMAEHKLPADEELVRPVLFHRNLSTENIVTEDGRITGVTDWQDCWTGPLLLQVREPVLINAHWDPVFELPPHFDDMEEGPEKELIRSKVENSNRLECYFKETIGRNPLLDRTFAVPYRHIIRGVVTFANNTWDTDPKLLEEHLFKMYRFWGDMYPGQECPYDFTYDEFKAHYGNAQDWNLVAEFWDRISDYVSRDGYVLPEDYDHFMKFFAEMREECLEETEGEEREAYAKALEWVQVKT